MHSVKLAWPDQVLNQDLQSLFQAMANTVAARAQSDLGLSFSYWLPSHLMLIDIKVAILVELAL